MFNLNIHDRFRARARSPRIPRDLIRDIYDPFDAPDQPTELWLSSVGGLLASLVVACSLTFLAWALCVCLEGVR